MQKHLLNRIDEAFAKVMAADNTSLNGTMKALRRNSYDSFLKLGFPTKKNEDWKYTSLSFLNNYNFVPVVEAPKTALTPSDIDRFLFEDMKDNIVVLYNGYFSKELSRIPSGNGVVISSLRNAFATHPELIEKYYGKTVKADTEALPALNNALAQDGAFIYIQKGRAMEQPLHLLVLTDTANGDILVSPRNLVIAEEGSSARIVQTCYTFGTNAGFTNLITEINAGRDSVVDFYKMHNCRGKSYYVGTTEAAQDKNSVFNNISVSLNGVFHRNQVNTVHNDEHCETNYYGLYFLDGEDFVDNRTSIDHAKPNCRSNESYKGIIDGKAQAVFNGKILVRPDAQKTEAYQANKNILLSGDATINTKPQLEIFADDVKCSHGATTGSLDKEEMFYLLSRGIGENKARALLLSAFASDIIEQINIPQLRDDIKRQIAKRLVSDDIYFCEVLENHEIELR